jgi:phenylacetate-CoA ligase
MPFTTADDLREFYPFPLRAVPFEQIVRIHASSGTTGKRKIIGYTQKDLDDWVHFFARCYEMAGVTPLDRVQIAVGYGIWTAGMGFQLGCEKIGAMAVPVGPGNIDMHLQFMQDVRSTVFCSTASMALLMAEEIHRRGIADKISIRKIIYGSERSSRSMRRKISELFGGAELFDITGLTELYGPGTGIECADHDCIHYWGDYYIVEIIDPETLQPVPDGEWGEMVVTTLVQGGGAVDPLPHPGHHPHHSRRLHLRIGHAPPLAHQGPQRRYHQIQGRQHLSLHHRYHSFGDSRAGLRIPDRPDP